MSKQDGSVLSLETQAEAGHDEAQEDTNEREMYLKHGRKLAVASDGVSEIIEIRAASGALELRVNMTEDGPVLSLDGVKLAVNAEDSIELACKRFSVNATEAVDVSSDGELKVSSEGELNIRSEGADVRINGEKIYLN